MEQISRLIVNEVPALLIDVRAGESGVSALGSGTVSFSENKASIAGSGDIGISVMGAGSFLGGVRITLSLGWT